MEQAEPHATDTSEVADHTPPLALFVPSGITSAAFAVMLPAAFPAALAPSICVASEDATLKELEKQPEKKRSLKGQLVFKVKKALRHVGLLKQSSKNRKVIPLAIPKPISQLNVSTLPALQLPPRTFSPYESVVLEEGFDPRDAPKCGRLSEEF